jgi:hypothetical protein
MLRNADLLDRIHDAPCSACYAAQIGAVEWEWRHKYQCVDCGECSEANRDQPLIGRICTTCANERITEI